MKYLEDNVKNHIFTKFQQKKHSHWLLKSSCKGTTFYIKIFFFQMKNGKIDYEFAKKEMKKLPASMQGHVGKAIEDCKDSSKIIFFCFNFMFGNLLLIFQHLRVIHDQYKLT